MENILDRAQAYISRKYVSRADERQKAMGLAYVEAEKDDLAREFARFAEREIGRESSFQGVISIGFDKNGEADFRIKMSIADLDRRNIDELTRMMPWAIKEALEIYLRHGTPSKEMAAQAAPQQ